MQTAIRISALVPKRTPEATIAGIRAMTTSRITEEVVRLSRRWGDEETMSLFSVVWVFKLSPPPLYFFLSAR